MTQHIVKINSIKHITHDVIKIVTEKPRHYNYTPGQATEISINKEGWIKEKRPFTFTCLPQHDYLEFSIKTYPSHKGVTNELLQLKKKDELILHDVFGAIAYKSEGVFIDGGAGVTPFICIFRDLKFKNLLGRNFINILSDEKADGYAHGQITEGFLKDYVKDPKINIYVCGPPPMMEAIEKQLANLKIDEKLIIKEVF